MLILDVTIAFSNSSPKEQLDKFEGADFKYDNMTNMTIVFKNFTPKIPK